MKWMGREERRQEGGEVKGAKGKGKGREIAVGCRRLIEYCQQVNK